MKTKLVVVVTGLVILLLINTSIWQKQTHLAEGEEIYLELAPVDPRSIMQGDYMSLDYQLSREISAALTEFDTSGEENRSLGALLMEAKDGLVMVKIDENKVARFVDFDKSKPLTASQRRLQFRVRNSKVKFATNGYFFEEGSGPVFQNARYGSFRVNEQGEVLLKHLLDESFKVLGNEK